VLTQLSYWLIASVALVVTLGYRAYRANRTLTGQLAEERRRSQQMGELHLATIEALALAIDAKDQTTHNHVARVEVYASALARTLGMSEVDLQAVKTAALLHDIGKLGVPEHILAKPGPLTPDEFQKVRMHPQIGADILSAVPFPYPVAPLVLHHHERWDGRGYPLGLKGEEIPLGARILCLVDYFDALTSDRPYHKPLPIDQATELIKSESGKALDPRAVETFLQILPEASAHVESIATRGLRHRGVHHRGVPLQADLPDASTSEGAPINGTPRAVIAKTSVFEDIAVAHREIYALYEMAQSMGTTLGVAETMGRIATNLSRVVPFSACSLFLYSEDEDTVQCRFASGTDAELFQGLVMKVVRG
jgi:putative nucleotidyltransferase with HDIG domain